MKVVAILPAYNAARTLPAFIKNFPRKYFDEIILIDDYSSDATCEVAKKQPGIKVYRNPNNLGYGGNLKMCLSIASEAGADVIIEISPDGEYGFDGIGPAIEAVRGGADLVLGNRFGAANTLKQTGMFIWKYPFLKILSAIDNLILGTNVPDMHQGFRVYTRKFLKEVDYKSKSNTYSFSFEIIADAVYKKLTIESVPVSAHYSGDKRGASLRSSILYSLATFRVLAQYILAKIGIKQRIFANQNESADCSSCQNDYLVEKKLQDDSFSVFFCHLCQNGFTQPVPDKMERYYDSSYWHTSKGFGPLKQALFELFHSRRAQWVKKNLSSGEVLDVGAGEGDFGKKMGDSYTITSIDAPFAKVRNTSVIKTDFLKWKSDKRFDAIVFWESLEHVARPQAYLEKARSLLTPKGYIFVEYPQWNSLEAKIFGKNWYHLDLPRHLVHLTDRGVAIIGQRVELHTIRRRESILAPEYSFWGSIASLITSITSIKGRQIEHKPAWLMAAFILLPVSVVWEVLLYILNQSPIGLAVFRNTNGNKISQK